MRSDDYNSVEYVSVIGLSISIGRSGKSRAAQYQRVRSNVVEGRGIGRAAGCVERYAGRRVVVKG